MAEETVLVRYEGEVQGVGFRATCRAVARSYKVRGWVKNERDGSVSMIVTGEKAEVAAYLRAVRDTGLGPKIERETQERAQNVGELKGFDIRF